MTYILIGMIGWGVLVTLWGVAYLSMDIVPLGIFMTACGALMIIMNCVTLRHRIKRLRGE
jgi:hypothetical protein